MNDDKNIIMGLDISTSCIGICLMEYDNENPYGKIIELTHVNPKVPKKKKGIEVLFLKKEIFNKEFLSLWVNKGIKRVIIESPLLQSNNVNTVSTLLQFNGMISDSIYTILGIIPEYISSYEARKYSFPELMSIRRFDKVGGKYDVEKVIKSVKKNNFVLFGSYPWDIDKKSIIQTKVSEIFPNIQWLYDKNEELKKENFDACDAYVACLGFLNKEKYGELKIQSNNIQIDEKYITFQMQFWNKEKNIKIEL